MKLFLSYRAADLEHVERLHDALVAAYGGDAVIRDLIPLPFVKGRAAYVQDSLSAADVMLVVIGPAWPRVTDAAGRLRLRLPDDPVRLEIEAALALGIPLLCVLVGGASLPNPRALPPTIRALCGRGAHPLRPECDYAQEAGRLVAAVERLVAAPPRLPSRVVVDEQKVGLARWWEVRLHLRAEHILRYDLMQTGFRPTCRFSVDGRTVWSARSGWTTLPSVDLPFRIESENASGWLVCRDRSNRWGMYHQTVEIWIENTRIFRVSI